MGSTPNYGFPYPDGPEPPSVAKWNKDLADKVEGALGTTPAEAAKNTQDIADLTDVVAVNSQYFTQSGYGHTATPFLFGPAGNGGKAHPYSWQRYDYTFPVPFASPPTATVSLLGLPGGSADLAIRISGSYTTSVAIYIFNTGPNTQTHPSSALGFYWQAHGLRVPPPPPNPLAARARLLPVPPIEKEPEIWRPDQ